MKQSEQQFLKELEGKLWNAADKLRSTLDAAQYKHAVLGLIFVKYVSDAFKLRQEEIKAQIDALFAEEWLIDVGERKATARESKGGF